MDVGAGVGAFLFKSTDPKLLVGIVDLAPNIDPLPSALLTLSVLLLAKGSLAIGAGGVFKAVVNAP